MTEEQQQEGGEQQQEQEQEQQSTPEQLAVENEARLYGWKPKEEFDGDETEWRSAEDFVKRGKEINPILRKNNERLKREIDAQAAELQELKLTVKEFGEMYQKMSNGAHDRAIADAKEQRRAALAAGDHVLADELADHIADLKESAKNTKAPKVSETPQVNEQGRKIFTDWAEENSSWYNSETNPAILPLVDGVALRLAKTNRALVGTREFLDMVKEEVKRLSPHTFVNGARRTGSPVSGSGATRSGAGAKTGKSYNDLPPEAQKACDRFVKNIPGYTREKYLESYFE